MQIGSLTFLFLNPFVAISLQTQMHLRGHVYGQIFLYDADSAERFVEQTATCQVCDYDVEPPAESITTNQN